MHTKIATFAEQLKMALQRPSVQFARPTLAKEALDLLAVASGLKPLAVLCEPTHNSFWAKELMPILDSAPVETMYAPYWNVQGEFDSCPAWYERAVRERRKDLRLRVAYRPRSNASISFTLTTRNDISVIAESKLLCHPVCCVRQQFEMTKQYHNFRSTGIGRTAGPDAIRMQEETKAGVYLAPDTGNERRKLRSVSGNLGTQYLNMVMCEECYANPRSPAQTISRDYAELAQKYGLTKYVAEDHLMLAGE